VIKVGYWIRLVLEICFLPTHTLYVFHDYLSGFEGYLVYLVVGLGFLYDMAMGYGVMFTVFALFLVFLQHSEKVLSPYELFIIFTVAWLFVLLYRGFPHIYTLIAMTFFLWEVYVSVRKKRLIY
jgi:hypothetical protein